MMARTSVGRAGRERPDPGGASSERGAIRILDVEFEPPAIDHHLDAGPDHRRPRVEPVPRHQSTSRCVPSGPSDVARCLTRHLPATSPVTRSEYQRSLHRGHRSTCRLATGRPPPGGRCGRAHPAPAWHPVPSRAARPGPRSSRPSMAASPAAWTARRTSPSRVAAGRPSGPPPNRSRCRRTGRRLAGDPGVERQGRLDAGDPDFPERPGEPIQGGVTVVGEDHDLGHQVVVVGRDPVALDETGVHAHARARRHVQRRTVPGFGAKSRDGSSAVSRTSMA